MIKCFIHYCTFIIDDNDTNAKISIQTFDLLYVPYNTANSQAAAGERVCKHWV